MVPGTGPMAPPTTTPTGTRGSQTPVLSTALSITIGIADNGTTQGATRKETLSAKFTHGEK